MTISRSGMSIVIGGEVEDSVAAAITKKLTQILADKAAADPLAGEPTTEPTPPQTDTQVNA